MLRLAQSVALFVFAFFLPLPALSQSPAPSADLPANSASLSDSGASDITSGAVISPTPSPGRYREVSFYAAQSLGYAEFITAIGTQRVFIAGVRMTSRLYTGPHLNLSYNADLKPVVLHSMDVGGSREYTYGGAGSIGLQFAPHNNWRWQPFFDVDGGLVGFTQDTPVPGSRRMNITLDFGPGFYLPVGDRHSLKTGFWVFHFSNADTAARNPGCDGFLIYASFTIRNIHLHPHHNHPS